MLTSLLLAFTCALPVFLMGQPPMHLTLLEAQQLAIHNNPQFTAAATTRPPPTRWRLNISPSIPHSLLS